MKGTADLSLSPGILRTWHVGTVLLWAGLLMVLLLVLYMAWSMQEHVLLFIVVPAILPIALFLIRHEDLFLYLALAGFVAITNRVAGIQVAEAVYGLFFLGFLGYWFFLHVYIKRDVVIKTSVDWALLLFLSYAVLSTTWAIFFGAKISVIIGEGLILVMMAFYFPIVHLIRSNPHKLKYILLVVCWIGIYVSVRNIMEYRADLSAAEKLYNILSGRVSLNEVLLMMPALGALTFLLYAQTNRARLVLGGLFILFFVSLIVTQSRGYWMAFFLGAFTLFILTDIRRKMSIMILFLSGLAGFVLIGLLLFPAYIPLIVVGVVERLASIGTAFSSDISLVNRFYESMTVWGYIKENPILGYGMGTPYEYFNIISDHTRRWAFIHNGYLGMWYKYGIIGLGLLMFFWIRSIWLGITLFKSSALPSFYRISALACTICLVGEMLVANTSTPFQSEDPTLMITILAAVITGLHTAASFSGVSKGLAR